MLSRGSRRRRGEDARRRGGPATQAGSLVAWRPRARRALSLLCLLPEVGDDWHQARWAGPAQVRPKWASVSLSFNLFQFSILFCFVLI